MKINRIDLIAYVFLWVFFIWFYGVDIIMIGNFESRPLHTNMEIAVFGLWKCKKVKAFVLSDVLLIHFIPSFPFGNIIPFQRHHNAFHKNWIRKLQQNELYGVHSLRIKKGTKRTKHVKKSCSSFHLKKKKTSFINRWVSKNRWSESNANIIILRGCLLWRKIIGKLICQY